MWIQKGEDNGRWTELVNSETGESSIKEHKLKVVWKSCAENKHKWTLSGNRELQCLRCGMIRPFVLGIEKFEDGEIKKI